MLNSHTPTLDDRQHYAQDPAPLRYKLSYMGEPVTADGDPAPPAALLPRMLPLPVRIQQKLIATGLVFCPSARIADTLRLPATADTDVDVLSLSAAATPRSASPAFASLDSAFAAAADVDSGATDSLDAPPSLTLELPSALSPAVTPLHSARTAPAMPSVSLPAPLHPHIGRHRSQRPKYATLKDEEGYMLRYGFDNGGGRDRPDDFKFAACAPVVVDALVAGLQYQEEPM
jgi:hypothetical protein